MRSRIALKRYFAQNPKKYSKSNPVPPRTVFVVRRENSGPYRNLLGKLLRVGYYSKQDGLNCIWIVDEGGVYAEATVHQHLNRYFQVLAASDESDLYGEARPMLVPLSDEEMLHLRGNKEIEGFLGLLANRTKNTVTIEEINDATAQSWAGER